MSRLPEMFDGWRRKKVVQWAVAYLAAAWVVMQLVEVLGGRWSWPIWIQRLVDVLLLVGFIAVLVLAWYHGEQGRQRVSGPELVMIGLLLVIAGFQVGLFRPDRAGDTVDDGRTLAGAVTGAGGAGDADSGRDPARPLRLELLLPDSAGLAFVGDAPLGIGRQSLAISPDGQFVVYAAERPDGGTRLCRRDLDQFVVVCLPGTEGAVAPFISGDGRRLAFFARGELRVMSAGGGEPASVMEIPNPVGGAWVGDSIIVAGEEGTRVWALSVTDGARTTIPVDVRVHSTPAVLPNGGLIFSVGRVSYVFDRGTGETRPLLRNAESPRFLPPATLLFTRGADLMAVDMDPETSRVVGEPRLVMAGVRVESQGSAQFAVSERGTVVAAPGNHSAAGRFHWVEPDGEVRPLPFAPETMSKFQLSPDGSRVAAGVLRTSWDIWLFDLEEATRRRLTRSGDNQQPTWSPDGEWVYYRSRQENGFGLYRKRADGSGTPILIASSATAYTPSNTALDGTLLSTSGGHHLHTPERPGEPQRVWSDSGADRVLARISPDGRRIAYVSDQLGRYEVYVAPAGDGRHTQLTTTGGEEPIWNADGTALYFRNGHDLMRLPLRFDQGRVASADPRRVFHLPGWINVRGHSYDVAPDGRVLVTRRGTEDRIDRLRVISGKEGF